MAVFDGGLQYCEVTGLPEPGGNPNNLVIKVNLAAPLTGQGDHVIADGRINGGVHELHYGGSGTSIFQIGGVASSFINSGVATDNWGSVASYFQYSLTNASAIEGTLRLFGDTTATRDNLAVNVSSIEFFDSTSPTPNLLATFDLTNPTQATIPNSNGSLVGAELTLFNFNFGSPSVTVTNTTVARGGTIDIVTQNLGTLTSWTITDEFGHTYVTTGTDTTIDVPPLVGATGGNRIGYGQIYVTVGDGTDTANSSSATIPLTPPDGFAFVALTAGFQTGINTYLYNYTGTPEIGDQFTYDPNVIELRSNGRWASPSAVNTFFWGFDLTDAFEERQTFEVQDSTPANAFNTSNVVADATTARSGDATVTASQSNVTGQGRKIVGTTASVSSTSNVTAIGQASTVVSGDANTNSNTDVTALASTTRSGGANASSSSNVTAIGQASGVGGGSANVNSNSDVTAVGVKSTSGVVNVSSESDVTAVGEGTGIGGGIVNASSSSNVVALSSTTRNGGANTNSESDVTITGSASIPNPNTANTNSNSQVTVAASKSTSSGASVNSSSNVTMIGGKNVGGVANVSSQSQITMVSGANVLPSIDPDLIMIESVSTSAGR